MEAQIISLRDYSLSFKSLYKETKVVRENLLDEIESFVNRGYKIIIVDGNDGSGKTNLLLQYAKKHNQNSFSYFINTACSSTFKQDYILEDLGKQIYFYNKSEALDYEVIVDESIFGKLIFELMRIPEKRKKPIYFVLDGLDQIEKADLELLKQTLNSLPWNSNNFHFILSGDSKKLMQNFSWITPNNSKSIWVPRFTFDECCEFFEVTNSIDKQYIKEIYNTWKGHPDDLIQIKSIVEGGISLEEFVLKDDIKEKQDLLEIIWSRSLLENLDFSEEIIQLLSIITFNDNIQSLQKICDILNSDFNKMEEEVKRLSFLFIHDGLILFAFKSFRVFLSKKLKKHERKTSTLLVNFFSNRTDFDSIVNLPSLYTRNNEWGDIIQILNPENIRVIISNSRSFSEIKHQINFGYRASVKLNTSSVNLFVFSLYRSVIGELQRSYDFENKIKAYISIGKKEDALSLLTGVPLKEDRIKMLIYYVKECKLKHETVDQILIEEIKNTLQEIDREFLAENIIDIITWLAHFLPEVAIQVIEKVTGLSAEDNSLEWLIGYVATIIDSNKKIIDSENISKDVSEGKSRATNLLESFSKSIGIGINDVKEEEIIDYIDDVESLTDKIFLLRTWIKHNKKASNIYTIINKSITILLQSSSNLKPTTTIIFDLISPLPEMQNYDEIKEIITRVDELLLSISSPTIDKVKIEILIIESILKFDDSLGNDRAIQLEKFVSELTDYNVRTEALADLWLLVKTIEKKNIINLDEFIIDENFAKQNLLKSIEILLESSADHFKILESTIEIISSNNLEFAIFVSKLLNTEDRRCNAYVKCIDIYTDNNNIDVWDEKQLFVFIENISIIDYYTKSIHIVLDAAYNQSGLAKNHLNKIEKLIPLINKVEDYVDKCFLITKSIRLLSLKPSEYKILPPNYKRFIKKLEEHLLQFWNKIEIPWQKAIVGYKISSKLSNYNKELAEDYFFKSGLATDGYMIDNMQHSRVFYESIRLMISYYCKVITFDKNYKYDKLENLISYLPSKLERANLWSELAVRAKLANVNELAEEIVNKKVMPIINYFSDRKEKENFIDIVHICGSALYLTQPATLKLFLDSIPARKKTNIIYTVCYVLITGHFEADPYKDNVGNKKFKFQEADQFIDLIEMLELDVDIFTQIKRLCSVVKDYPNNFVREQKISIQKRLLKIVSEKIPNTERGIKHEGYAIACEAYIQHFDYNSGKKNLLFEDLESRTIKIDNITDRSLVFSVLATESDNKRKKLDYLNKSFDEADKIVSLREKVSAYEIALEAAKIISKEVFTAKLKKIHDDIYKLDSNEVLPTFRRLIDIAYSFDKSSAQKLVSSLDNDPARKKMALPSNNHFDSLELEKTVLGDYSQFGRIKSRKDKASVAITLLGQLNADKRTSREISDTIPILRSASRIPFLSALPMYEFFVQNSIKQDNSLKSVMIPFYEASYSNARLTFDLICNISNKKNSINFNEATTKESFLALPNTRDEALEFISNFVKPLGSKEIYLVDPYFSEEDMQFVKDLMDWSYGASLSILTSCKSKGDFSKFSYNNAWNKVSSEDFPNIFFVKVTNQNKESPFHDRWILFADKEVGLRFGTSINAFGLKKVSEISVMHSPEVLSKFQSVVQPLIIQRTRDYEEHIVKFETFDL